MARVRARLAVACLVGITLAAAAADLLPYSPHQVRTSEGVQVLRPPSDSHWLGTDDRGRDVLSRLLHGARTSLVLAAGVVVLSLGAGGIAGGLAAGRGGAVDATVVGGLDVVTAVPALLLVVAVQGLWARASMGALVFLIAIPQAAYVARVVRAELRNALVSPFVEAARALGASPLRITLFHALPHAVPQVAACVPSIVAASVLAEAALTFIGLGVSPPTPSWGELLRQAHQNQLAWWLAAPAGGAVALVTLSAQVLADGSLRQKSPSAWGEATCVRSTD
ncbi:MAG: ABC transporter permease [Deltaproteobacteria bacterium]|nr:ABC transporter permease [Deltaproteobacteria bacterium]